MKMKSDMLLMQISSAQGPVECCRAVVLVCQRICDEAQKLGLVTTLVEQIDGPAPQTARSIMLALQVPEHLLRAGQNNTLQAFAKSWQGTVQWIYQSTYRPGHKRKNWYVGVGIYDQQPAPQLQSEIVFETMRASGPGGQHVNTSATAVRATHTASGISVKVQTERSQYANKRLALILIAKKLEEKQAASQNAQKKQQWLQHYQLERGNPVRVFSGEDFVSVSF